MFRHGSLNAICLLALATLLGCGDVDHCKPKTMGCLGGPPSEGGLCLFGLVPRRGICVEPTSGGSGDGRPQPNPCGSCSKGQTCATDKLECVDFCNESEPQPGTELAPDPIRCGGEIKNAESGETYALSFDEVCVSNCQLACRLRDWFCKTGCAKDACTLPEVLSDCHARCDGDAEPLSCVQRICNDTRATGCTSVQGFCAGSELPDCSAIECKNNCATTAYDGVCDDGDLFNAKAGSCAWGSDCADCGPREGDDISHELKQGSLCSLQEQCSGHSADFGKNAGFCAQVVTGSKLRRCVLDCSGTDELCPGGTTCTTLRAEKSEGGTRPLLDANGVRGKACLPDACI